MAIGCWRNASLIAINITQSLPRTVHDSDYEILVVVDLRALRLQSRHAKGLVTLAVLQPVHPEQIFGCDSVGHILVIDDTLKVQFVQ